MDVTRGKDVSVCCLLIVTLNLCTGSISRLTAADDLDRVTYRPINTQWHKRVY